MHTISIKVISFTSLSFGYSLNISLTFQRSSKLLKPTQITDILLVCMFCTTWHHDTFHAIRKYVYWRRHKQQIHA